MTETAAYMNHGRWVVDCPATCHAAYLASPGSAAFRCFCCEPVCSHGEELCLAVIAPVWPANWLALQQVLNERPDPTTRNWFPHETVQDLIAENIRHKGDD